MRNGKVFVCLLLSALGASVVAGCGVAPEADATAAVEKTESTASAIDVENGRSLNGRSLNGRALNGRALNGRALNGRALNGRTIDGISARGFVIDGDELGAVSLDGTWLDGRGENRRRYRKNAFVGAEMSGVLDDGTNLPLRIDAIDAQRAESSDVHLYDLSFRTDAGWEPYCGLDARGRAVPAIPLAGAWDYREGANGGGAHIDDEATITFACQGFVLAKCVELGYAPWREVRSCSFLSCRNVSLAAHHQACTRMLRADFCGDGSSHTSDGTLINVYDGVGIQRDTERWTFEAEWTEDGARCVDRGRTTSLPACALSRLSENCGHTWHFLSGTRLMTEDRPASTASGSGDAER